MRWLALLALLALLPSPVVARDTLGLFGSWGAFRDRSPERLCYGIAEPIKSTSSREGLDRGQPALSIGIWPRRRGTMQLYMTGGYVFAPKQTIELTIGGKRFNLYPQWNGAWAADDKTDQALIARMRRTPNLTISALSLRGARITDTYSLDGFGAALDAAQAGCR